jgi:hypothetical protein
MDVVRGTSTDAQWAIVEAAIVGCAFPLDYLSAIVTISVENTLGHAGKLEGLTTAFGDGTYTIQLAPGLFESGNALYVDEAFIYESIVHELGHVATLDAPMWVQTGMATILGFDYATQWSPSGALITNWVHAGKEAAAECFKDLFASRKHFNNRTDFQLPDWAYRNFCGLLQGTILGGPSAAGTVELPVTSSLAIPGLFADPYSLPPYDPSLNYASANCAEWDVGSVPFPFGNANNMWGVRVQASGTGLVGGVAAAGAWDYSGPVPASPRFSFGAGIDLSSVVAYGGYTGAFGDYTLPDGDGWSTLALYLNPTLAPADAFLTLFGIIPNVLTSAGELQSVVLERVILYTVPPFIDFLGPTCDGMR